MNKKVIILIIIAVAVILSSLSWGNTVPEYGSNFIGDVLDIENTESANIKGVQFICDVSGSVKGYVDFTGIDGSAQNNMIGVVSTIVNRIKNNYSPDFKAQCGSASYDADGFIRRLKDGQVFTGSSSKLWELIDKGVKYASDSTVSIVLSDMVLSYGSSEIRSHNNLYYNQHNLDGLKGEVISKMTDAKQKGLEVVVIQYKSDFNGTYYFNCQENIENLNPLRIVNNYRGVKMEDRPYYLMLIGTEENLNSIVSKGCYQKCENMYATFVAAEPACKDNVAYNIMSNDTNVWRAGHYPNGNGGFYCLYTPNDYSSFSISCNEVKLPRYYYSNANSFRVGCNKSSRVESVEYNGSTLSFTLTTGPISQMFKPGDNGEFSMDVYSMNKWVDESSVIGSDVDEAQSIKGKTWGLKALFDGINSVYYPDGAITESKVATVKFNYYINK